MAFLPSRRVRDPHAFFIASIGRESPSGSLPDLSVRDCDWRALRDDFSIITASVFARSNASPGGNCLGLLNFCVSVKGIYLVSAHGGSCQRGTKSCWLRVRMR